ncbi:hypothetical protein FRC03_003168 [Tulasnella sp. 419]|nr:hypothetical protein FRC03_003168 [Tulasnella sp. 419]
MPPRKSAKKKGVLPAASKLNDSVSQLSQPLPSKPRTIITISPLSKTPGAPLTILPNNPEDHSSTAITQAVPIVWEYDLAFMVLRNLSLTHLKSARLVCKRWDVLVSAIMEVPTTRRLDELLNILGPTKHHLDTNGRVLMLGFNIYRVTREKRDAFLASARGVRKLDLALTRPKQTAGTLVGSVRAIAPEVFMALSVVCKKSNIHHYNLFNNLQELTISEDLFSVCPYAFTPTFFPPSVQTLNISNLGHVSIQTVFEYLSSIASYIKELKIHNHRESAKLFKPLSASYLEAVSGIQGLECKGLTNEWDFLQALAGGCPNLKGLQVEYGSCGERTESTWRSEKFPSLQFLTLLHVPEVQASNMVLFFQKTIFCCISSLEVSFQGYLPSDTLDLFLCTLSSRQGGLQSLSISNTNADTSWTRNRFELLMGLPKIQYLSLNGYFSAGDEQLRILCEGLPKLRSLVLEGYSADITVNALRCCNPETNHPLVNLRMHINGNSFKQEPSLMELPRDLETLSLNIEDLREDLVAQLAARISSTCPANAAVTFTGSSAEAISSLESVFHTLHTWRRESELRTIDAMRSIRNQLTDLSVMYRHVVHERDIAVQERRALEVLVGSVGPEDYGEVL